MRVAVGDFLQRNFAHLALTLQAFAKSSPGHESKPILADTRGAAARSNIAADRKPTGCGERPFLCPYYPDDLYLGRSGVTVRRFSSGTPIGPAQGAKNPLDETIGGVPQQCQTSGNESIYSFS